MFDDPALTASYQFYKQAQTSLKPFNKVPMPEARVRELIHQTGVRTFERPKGIPENFLVKITDRGAGMEYFHPDKISSIRVMPGKPHSPWPYQQNPYVIIKKEGSCINKFGQAVLESSPEAHISYQEFIQLENML